MRESEASWYSDSDVEDAGREVVGASLPLPPADSDINSDQDVDAGADGAGKRPPDPEAFSAAQRVIKQAHSIAEGIFNFDTGHSSHIQPAHGIPAPLHPPPVHPGPDASAPPSVSSMSSP